MVVSYIKLSGTILCVPYCRTNGSNLVILNKSKLHLNEKPPIISTLSVRSFKHFAMRASTILVLLLYLASAQSFTVKPKAFVRSTRLFSSDDQKDRLTHLGFTEDELERSKRGEQVQKVRVDLVPNVDAATLTAVGFAAIAFNFFVLANMGDGGIGGFVARIINTWDN